MPAATQQQHANPNSSSHLAATTTKLHGTSHHHHHHEVDPQVAVVADDQPLPSLCDVVAELLLQGRDPVRPTLSRLVLVGGLLSKEEPLRPTFEDIATTAANRVNSRDPLSGKGHETIPVMNISSLLVEFPNHFLFLLESEPAHLLEFVRETQQRKLDNVKQLHVVYYVDDIIRRSCNKNLYLELTAPSQALPAEEEPLQNIIVDTIFGLTQLAELSESGKQQPDVFLAQARTSQVSLMPKGWFVEKCITSGMCLTLAEYVSLFCKAPVVTRGCEVLDPVEDPLPH